MKRTLTIVASMAVAASINAADVRVGANITQDTVWTSDNTYFLDAQVYVIDGAELTIEPGTVVKGATLGTAASALIITRGSKLYALGTPSSPIVFTAESDPLDGSFGAEKTALWGGVIVLGAAPVNSHKNGFTGDFLSDPQVATTENVEGLNNSADNDWTEFGGLDPEDSSGIIRYVSIRHGGAEISANNEINGLSMGGVGRGTIIEFVEVFANKDDGFEWFGGTVDARFLVAAYCNDESFDYDQGWTGRGQFWFTIGTKGVAGTDEMDHAGEHDGTVNVAHTPLNHPYRGMGDIFNATYIGANQNEGVFGIEDDAGVHYYNSIFMDFAGHGVDVVSDAIPGLTETIDGVTRIDFRNNIWFNIGDGTASALSPSADVVTFLTAAGKGNTIEDPMLYSVSRTNDGGLDPRPMASSPAFTNARKALPADPWYIPTTYQGAFGETNWMYGWTYLHERGYLPELVASASSSVASISSVISIEDGGTASSGFQVRGELPVMFIVRAKGPKLADAANFEPADTLPNPQLELFRIEDGVRELVAVETGWTDRSDMITVASEWVGLAPLTASDARPTVDEVSAAVVVSLNPGLYSVRVSDEEDAGGFAQVEVYAFDF